MISCTQQTVATVNDSIMYFHAVNNDLVNEKGNTIATRFIPPTGFKRDSSHSNSFAFYHRNLPLKPAGAVVKYYNIESKKSEVYEAVIDMDIGKKDLQQCADAAIRLRAEYFYVNKKYEQITFNFTNGFKVQYAEWMKGNRVVVDGNKASWRKTGAPSNTYEDFRKYLDVVFTYAGTLSLEKSLKPKSIRDISAGDIFIHGGSPGHAVIVVDAATKENGGKAFLLAQSFMPAQDIHILKNPNNPELSPWYSSVVAEELITPEWTFKVSELRTW